MIAYLISQLALVVFGAFAVLHPNFRLFPIAARVALAFLFGTLFLTLEATLLSIAGISWGERTLPIPFVIALIAAIVLWRKKPSPETLPAVAGPRGDGVSAFAAIAIVIAVIQLIAGIASGRANDTGFLFTTGAKGARFAEARGIEFEFLSSANGASLDPAQPPLLPVTHAWSDIAAARETMRHTPWSALLWIAATLAVITPLLRRRLTRNETVITIAFWLTAVVNAAVAHRLAGSADIPLIAFTTVAAVALLTRAGAGDDWIAATALGGLVLTRRDGYLLALLILATHFALILRQRRWTLAAIPAAAVVIWAVAMLANGLPLFHFGAGKPFWHVVSRDPLTAFGGGSFFLASLFPLLMLVQARRRLRQVSAMAIAIALAIGALPLLAALASLTVDAEAIARSFLPITSLLIFTAAVATFSRRPEEKLPRF